MRFSLHVLSVYVCLFMLSVLGSVAMGQCATGSCALPGPSQATLNLSIATPQALPQIVTAQPAAQAFTTVPAYTSVPMVSYQSVTVNSGYRRVGILPRFLFRGRFSCR